MDSLYHTQTSEDNQSLRKLLTPLLTTAVETDAAQRDPAKELQILDLACGSCREVEAVSSALRSAVFKGRGKNPPIRFVGADIRAAQLKEAADRAKSLQSPDFAAEFLNTDCARLDRHRQLGREFDLVFLRHQNFWDHPGTWRRIFEDGLERLNDSGLLVITSYFDREHELALQAIRKSGGQLLASVMNDVSRELSTPGKSVDRHIAVFRRPSATA